MSEKPVSTPKTKVLQLLEAYPSLEAILMAIVPVVVYFHKSGAGLQDNSRPEGK